MRKLFYWLYEEYLTPERIEVPLMIKLRSFVFASSLAKLSIGLWLLNPYYNTFATSSTYDTLKTQVTEPGFGLLLSLIGLIGMYGVGAGITQLRAFVGYSSLLIYLYLATMFAISNIQGLAIPLWGTMAVCEFINCTVWNSDVYRRFKSNSGG